MKKIILTLLTILMTVPMLRAENIGVPAECEDVMLQVYYWDSYKLTKYGRTKWVDLLKDTAEINAYFDLVWFPPSAKGGGVGYNHVCLSNQSSDWGQRTSLVSLIAALHRGNTKVLADIVINHRGNSNSWCTFAEDKFGEGYGSFQFTNEHICKDDELNQSSTKSDAGDCWGTASGAYDTGANFEGGRDLDHTNPYVQEWAKTYTRWMLDSMKYDGFRYDMTAGYKGEYLGMYNEASQPYFSVSEFWDGIDKQKAHLAATGYNTLVFDFPLKWQLRDAIINIDYTKLKKNYESFRGQDLERYGVTFIDNHDTFEREDNKGAQYGGYNSNLQDAYKKAQIMQAQAYLLMMPEVPCVFWPHWVSYKEDIKMLIAIRKLAGIHSESKVLEETATKNLYSATIQGHNRKVILRLGRNRDQETPSGYFKGAEGDHYSVFYEVGEGIEEVNREELRVRSGEKFVRNGQLLIRVGEHVFDATGRMVE